MEVSFGRNEQQEQHAFRHVIEAQMNVVQVRALVLLDLESEADRIGFGLYRGQISCEGVVLEYNAYKFEDDSINVGRITLG